MTENATPAAFPAPTTSLHLQGVGQHPALRADELVRGCVTAWNGGELSAVLAVEPASAHFLNVTMQALTWTTEGYELTGEPYARRMRKDRTVGYSPKVTVEIGVLPSEAPVEADEPAPVTRHDFTTVECDLINLAVRLGFADAVEIGVLMLEHGPNAETILARLDDFADARRHCTPAEQSAMRDWFAARESVRVLQAPDDDREDKFGFRAEAVANARAIVERLEVRA